MSHLRPSQGAQLPTNLSETRNAPGLSSPIMQTPVPRKPSAHVGGCPGSSRASWHIRAARCSAQPGRAAWGSAACRSLFRGAWVRRNMQPLGFSSHPPKYHTSMLNWNKAESEKKTPKTADCSPVLSLQHRNPSSDPALRGASFSLGKPKSSGTCPPGRLGCTNHRAPEGNPLTKSPRDHSSLLPMGKPAESCSPPLSEASRSPRQPIAVHVGPTRDGHKLQ